MIKTDLRGWILSVLGVCSLFAPLAGANPPTPSYKTIEDKASTPVLTPSLQQRKIAKIQLDNGLSAYIVSDPGATESAAVLTVGAGCWMNPPSDMGLAHFLEHMLFLGTEKYPQESAFQEFIANHAGQTNAMTSMDQTMYLFSVDTEAYPEALDRFSQFFIHPLFNPSGVQRERHAVDQEFSNYVESDSWREMHVSKELANPNHPYSVFDVGNLTTLDSISQTDLTTWFEKYYSANLMHLIVYSPLPLDRLVSFVVEDFSAIPNRHTANIDLKVPLFTDDALGKMVYIEPIKELRQLSLTWELPEGLLHDDDEAHIVDAVCFVLGDEGPGSLLASLKSSGLATALSASGGRLGGYQGMLSIEISLTPEGLKKRDEVIGRCFETIANFTKEGYPEYLYHQLHNMDLVHYQYASRMKLPYDLLPLAREMPHEDLSTFPERSLLTTAYDPKGVATLLTTLTPERCLFMLIAKENETGIATNKTERWMGARYSVQPIAKEQLQAWGSITPTGEISLPAPNPFIPENLTLVSTSQERVEHPKPSLHIDGAHGTMYFIADSNYLVPEIYWALTIQTPAVDTTSAKDTALLELYVAIKNEQLNEELYQASTAGLLGKFTPAFGGLALSISGYSEKAPLLLDTMISALHASPCSQDFFEEQKRDLARKYANAANGSPLAQGSELIKTVLYAHYQTADAKGAALSSLSWDDFQQFSRSLFHSAYVEGLFYGNLSSKEAEELWGHLGTSLAAKPYPVADHPKKEVIILPAGPWALSKPIQRQGTAVILMTQEGPFSFERGAAQDVLAKAVEQPFFSELRTRQQTGYTVMSWPAERERQLYSFYAIQSNSHDAPTLLARFDLFLETFYRQTTKATFSPEQFATLQLAAANQIAQPPHSLAAMGERLNTLAFEYGGDFGWFQEKLTACQQLSYDAFLSFAAQSLGRHNRQRLAVLIEGELSPQNQYTYETVKSLSAIRQASTYSTADGNDSGEH